MSTLGHQYDNSLVSNGVGWSCFEVPILSRE